MNYSHVPSFAVARRRRYMGALVAPINPIVVARPDAASCRAGELVSIDLTINDGPSVGALVVTYLGAPTLGTVSLQDDGHTADFRMPEGTPADTIARFGYSIKDSSTNESSTSYCDVLCAQPVEPAVVCGDDSIEVYAGSSAVTVPVTENDAFAGLVEITAKTNLSPAVGSLAIATDKQSLVYTPPASIASQQTTFSDYTLRNLGGTNTDIGRLSITVKPATSPSGAYAWAQAFPSINAIDTSRIVMWDITKAVPKHNIGDLIVGTGPAGAVLETPIAGLFQGPLALIGITLRPKGWLAADYSTPAKPVLGTTALILPKFSAKAVSHWTWNNGFSPVTWPFLFLSNVYIDYQTNLCSFGDMLRIEQEGNQTNAANGDFRGPKAAVILNKIYMNKGPHYVSDTVDPKQNGHSDGIQSLGGVPLYKAADCYFDWPAGQLFYSGREAQDCGWARKTRWDLRNVSMKHSAAWNPNAQSTKLTVNPQFIKCTEEPGDGKFESYVYDEGKYMAVMFGSQCYVQGRFALSDKKNVMRYVQGSGGITGMNASGDWQFSTAVKGNHTFPAYSGSVRYLPPGATLPSTCNVNETGQALRIRDKTHFLQVLGIKP